MIWLVYVRWDNGKRETIRTERPDDLPARDRLWVMACLPEWHVTVQPAVRWRNPANGGR